MRYTKGITLKLLNISLFTAISVLSIYVHPSVHKLQAFWLISLMALVCLFVGLRLTNLPIPHTLSSQQIITFLGRAGCNIIGMWAWLEAIAQIGPNTSTAISYITPIFTTVLALLICKERLPVQCAIAIAVSFGGLWVILNPIDAEMLSYGGGMGLVAAFMWASHDIICKIQTKKEHQFIQAFYLFLFSTLLSAIPAFWVWTPIEIVDVLILAIIGVFAAINVVVIFMAYRAAPLIILMPFSYCRFILMAATTYVLLNEVVAPYTITGVIIIILASGYILYQQHKGRIVV